MFQPPPTKPPSLRGPLRSEHRPEDTLNLIVSEGDDLTVQADARMARNANSLWPVDGKLYWNVYLNVFKLWISHGLIYSVGKCWLYMLVSGWECWLVLVLLGSADATSNAPLGTLSFTDECPVHITVRCHVRLPEGKHNYMILYVFFDQTPDGYVCLWFSYGLPMVFLLKPPFSYGFSMVFLLKPPFSYGFPMVFLLKPPFSYGFLWFSY